MTAHFWSMGGYAAYVWSAYAVALAVLLWNAWVPWGRQRRLRRLLARQLEAES